MDIYFIHGLNHKKDYAPIKTFGDGIESLLAAETGAGQSAPRFVNLEIPGYETGNPLMYSVEQMVEKLSAQIEPGQIISGHSFGALLAGLVALQKQCAGLLVFQPWWDTLTPLPSRTDPADFLRIFLRNAAAQALYWTPKSVLKRLPAPGGGDVSLVSRFPEEWSKVRLLSKYPLTFYQDVIRWQRNLRHRKLRCGLLGAALSTQEWRVDNQGLFHSRNRAVIYMMDGLHQEVYDNPNRTVEIFVDFYRRVNAKL